MSTCTFEDIVDGLYTLNELKREVLNFDDYYNYNYPIYAIVFGPFDMEGYYVAANNESEAIDVLIDYLEEKESHKITSIGVEENDDFFLDTEGNEVYYDECIIGGNHSRVLLTNGMITIQEIDPESIR